MKLPSRRVSLAIKARHQALCSQCSCSVFVLAALGLLGSALPSNATAQGVTAGVLPSGTLPVLRGVVAGQAVVNAPVQGANRSTLTIDQTSSRAIINWNSFNISGDSEVLFRHPDSAASTLNRIFDANPSVIQGKLSSTGPAVNGKATAGGQLILINQNGILFDRGAQINVQSLVASTLNLSNERFLSGVLTAGGTVTPAFAGGYDDTGATVPNGSPSGSIVIGGSGSATADAPSLKANAGGSILLFAPTIDNKAGLIQAPDGQVILAAGSKVYLALNEDPNDITLRGFVVEVEAAKDGPGVSLTNLIRNAGNIVADRGNVTLAALAVNQEGRISAKTAVQNNGSIFLKARARVAPPDGAPANTVIQKAGSVTFKAGSVTEVMPDTADESTVPDSQNYQLYRGVIEATGRTIESYGSVHAAGGRIALTASDTTDPQGARVYLGEGSDISVAGMQVDVDPQKNLKEFTVTSNELKNSPDQKTGVLRGATVAVDLRQGNNILALDGYRSVVPRTVAEKAAAGGEVNITSTGSVIQRSGSSIDASGGLYRYAAGYISTTKLLGDDGKMYDIATAPQQRKYTKLLDRFKRVYERWGQTETFFNPLFGSFEAAYTEGLSGGVVTINSSAGLVLDGELKGGVTVGSRQLASAPKGAALRIGEFVPSLASFVESQRIGNITFAQQSSNTLGTNFTSTTALTQEQINTVKLGASQLFGAATQTDNGRVEHGFGSVELNSNGRIDVPEDVSIASDVGSDMTLRAPQVDIAGDIHLPAGSLTIRPTLPLTELVSADLETLSERVVVRGTAHLSTAGVWINNAGVDGAVIGTALPSGRRSADGTTTSSALDGGSITIQVPDPLFQTRLERGAILDVGGGASIASNKRVTGGKGGKLSIANGTAAQSTSDWMQASLSGFAVANGGELSLSFARAVIADDDANGLLPSATTRLGAGMFSDLGFSKITVTTTDGIDIAADTAVNVQQKNLVVDPLRAAELPTGSDLTSIASIQTLPDSQRAAASIVLNTRQGGQPGAAVLALHEGASISTDPRGEVSLSAVNGLSIDGRISAPGGKVNLTLSGPVELTAPDLRIGAHADISTAGVFVPTPNDRGLVQGSVINGGTVSINANNAGLVVEEGARIDVSAVSKTVDTLTNSEGASPQSQLIEGHAGVVSLKAQGAAQLNGTFVGHGGSSAAAGGSFSMELKRPDGQTTLPDERRIVVTSDLVSSEAGFADAAVNTEALMANGFDKLRLQSENRIEFRGTSTLDFARGIRLDAPLIELAGDARIGLLGSTVSLGQSQGVRQLVGGSDGDIWQLVDGAAQTALATRLGTGVLSIDAGAVDLYGSLTVNGTRLTRIASDSDVRLIGRPVVFSSDTGGQPVSRQIGGLTTAGNVEIQAAQVYPATRTEYVLAVKDSSTNSMIDGGSIQLSSNGQVPGPVYSAGGSVTLEAQTIQQQGVLKAPQGEIHLQASSVLDLGAGSVTSVSGEGLVVPYGTTRTGIDWVYTDGTATAATVLGAVSESGKRVELKAPTVSVQSGATVDLRGGGDVLATEFVPGSGGDNDITLQANTYAIMPAAQLAAMPFDSHIQALGDPGFGFSLSNGRDAVLYDSIQLGAGGAVPAGEYVLLPARYAQLANAYLVQLQTGSAYRNLQPGQSTTLPNGQLVQAGFRTARGTTVRESQSVGVIVRPGAAAVRQASDYNFNSAQFFADAATLARTAAPRAPWDAGRLQIANATSLTLDGVFETSATTSPAKTTVGRAAEIDIAGDRIAVVDRTGDPSVGAGFLQIAGASLSALKGSVLLGGTRADTETGIDITTSASDILVANSSDGAVVLPELMLAATQSIDVRAGSVLTASSSSQSTAPEVITTEASGALVRLSNSSQARVDRGAASDSVGDVRIAAGAQLTADKSLLLDATRSTQSLGQLRVGGAGGAGGSLSLGSVQVNLGETGLATEALNGLVLSNTDLANYASLDEFVLRGYGSIDLFGTTALGSFSLGRLSVDTPLLRGRDGGSAPQATLMAREIEFSNSSATVADSAVGTGSLAVQAERIVLDMGTKAVAGFNSTRFVASEQVSTRGAGSLRVAGALALDAPRVQAMGGSAQTISAVDTSVAGTPEFSALTLTTANPAVPATTSAAVELGGQLTLEGSRVSVANTVEARSGTIAIAAHGTGSDDTVTLASGAVLNASGQAKNFNGKKVSADGGTVSMSATVGAIEIEAGAKVDVSAAAEGGNAGRLLAQGTSMVLAGELAGRAGTSAKSGSAELDLGSVADFSALNAALNSGGFAEERQLRLRSGDIDVAAADHVAARRVTLTADEGQIHVAGTIGTGAAAGGARVDLYAKRDVTLDSGSLISAQASQAGARGGEVRVVSSEGAVIFDNGATIDVRAGDAGPAGSVTFGVRRDDSNVMASTRLEGTVKRWSAAGLAAQAAGNAGGDAPASVDVEATRTYGLVGSIDAATIDGYAADHEAFVGSVDASSVIGALKDETGALAGARVLGATEVRSTGDLMVDSAWNLTTDQWLAGGNPGTLTLRAAGNLVVSEALGAPDNNLLTGDSWSLRLAAGADLLAANPMATLSRQALASNSGSLTLSGANAKLRTGTGRIDLAAANHVRMDHVGATIYTAGRVGAADTETGGNNRWSSDGGSISIKAGGEISGASSATGDLWINEWLRRPRQSNSVFANLQPTDWWSYRPRFQQGVGTLGGGDIDISAGGNISDLAAMLPTTGRTYRDANGIRQVDVQGGGNLTVRSGADVVGSSFLVARGAGHVEAAGDVGVGKRSQLYVMGVSSGLVPEGASLDVSAGGSVALQTVSNPTAMFINSRDTSDPARGPSFGTQGSFSTFFTYSKSSQAGVYAKSGDLSYAGVLAPTWRTFNAVSRIDSTRTDLTGAFPASLSFVAFDGDITGPSLIDAVTTFPSAQASVAMLAGGSLRNVGFYGSDRDPSSVITPTGAYALANIGSAQIAGVEGLRPSGNQKRIVTRDSSESLVFDLQALEGSFLTDGTATEVVYTAPGRVRAGVDIVGASLRFQNLTSDDVTEVRADTGDFRSPVAVEVRGPGRLVVQAGRNVDLGTATLAQGSAGDIGGLVATGNNANPQLLDGKSARITVIAGVAGDVDLAKMDSAYAEIIALNEASGDVINLYRQLGTEADPAVILGATSVTALAKLNEAYASFVSLDQKAPRALAAYQAALRAANLPLGPGADSAAAANLYRLLNSEADVARLQSAGSLSALASAPGGDAYRAYIELEKRYPLVFSDYLQRRGEGALPTGVTPIVFSKALAEVVAQVVPTASITGGNIASYQTSIQTYGGSDIDLWAPGGNIVAGLTTPREDKTVGILTNAGGAIRSVVSGDFNINQGKVITAQGGDILMFSSQGSIDAGRGAKTTLLTPPPVRRLILDAEGNQTGVEVVFPAGATGSGIQSLTSDPDGLGPLAAPKAGNVYLFAPAGAIDAGEAGIRSSGNIVINAPTVLNSSGISADGSSSGVPVAASGSLAATVASSGAVTNTSKAGEDAAAAAATNAARAAAAQVLQKPTILTVEVLSFGEKK